jgi:DNA-binding response OmpR family regulator
MSKVLLIEDDHWLADSYRQILAANGFTCEVVDEAHLAMRAIDDSMPDVIVADVVLGDHTVVPLLHELQTYEDTRSVPIILCTAINIGADDLTKQLHSYGVVAVLDKATLTPETLLNTVREHTNAANSD